MTMEVKVDRLTMMHRRQKLGGITDAQPEILLKRIKKYTT